MTKEMQEQRDQSAKVYRGMIRPDEAYRNGFDDSHAIMAEELKELLTLLQYVPCGTTDAAVDCNTCKATAILDRILGDEK